MRFSNYYNHEGRNRNIYSRNNLLDMTMKELLERELELAYQYNTIGIPADEELMNSEFAHQYQDKNGFSHWQAGENPSMQSLDKANLVNQGITQDISKKPITESMLPDKEQLQGFGGDSNGVLQQTQSQKVPNLGTFSPESDGLTTQDLHTKLDKIAPVKDDFFSKQHKKEPLQKYVSVTDDEPIEKPYLRYEDFLGNETEEEKMTREQREIEAFDKLFEEELNKNDKTQNTEPYLTYEELLGLEPQSENAKEVPPTEEMLRKQMEENGVLTSGASGIENTPTFALDIEKTNKDNMTLKEKIIDKLIKNKIMTRGHYQVASDMYTDAVDNFSRAYSNNNADVLESMDSLDPKTIEYLKQYGAKPNERGVYYHENSNVSKKFAKSKELKDVIDKNIDSINNGNFEPVNINFDANMLDAIVNWPKFDRFASIQHAKLTKAYVDEYGKKHAQLMDNYDFNKRSDNTPMEKIKTLINNHGYDMQEKGNLENYYTIIDVLLEDDDLLDKIRRKKRH